MVTTNNQTRIAIAHNKQQIMDMLREIGINPDVIDNRRTIDLIDNYAAVIWNDNNKITSSFNNINSLSIEREQILFKLNAENEILTEITGVSKYSFDH